MLAVIWVGVRGWMAKGELEAAVPLAASVQQKIVAGSTDEATSDARDLVSHASTAVELTGDPIWGLAQMLPWVGQNFSAFRSAAEATDTVASRAVYPLVSSVDTIGLSSFQPVDGKVDLAALQAAQPTVSQARVALDEAASQVDGIDTNALVDPLAEAVSMLRDAVDGTRSVLVGADNAASLLPAMLGADGPRNYLLIFQNPAELRAGGGITSALALIHTEDGSVSLAQQASGADFSKFETPVMALPEETRGLFQDKAAQFVQNTTLVPEFDLSGQIAAAMWADRFGTQVDGVIAFDPVGLAYVLDATGPIELQSTGEKLTADDAVAFLLSDVYARYTDPKVQDAVFAEVAKAVFDRVAAGDIDQKKLLSAMVQSGDEQRIKIWSAHAEDQAVLADTTLAGILPPKSESSTGVGVYFNDATAAKMDYYLTAQTKTVSQLCRPDGRPIIRVQTTITNTAPADAGQTLPEYVTGGGAFGRTPGNITTYIYVYGPASVGDLSTSVVALNVDPGLEGAPSRTALDQGRTVAEFPITLVPGESRTVTVDFLAQPGDSLNVSAQITPMVASRVYDAETLPDGETCEIG